MLNSPIESDLNLPALSNATNETRASMLMADILKPDENVSRSSYEEYMTVAYVETDNLRHISNVSDQPHGGTNGTTSVKQISTEIIVRLATSVIFSCIAAYIAISLSVYEYKIRRRTPKRRVGVVAAFIVRSVAVNGTGNSDQMAARMRACSIISSSAACAMFTGKLVYELLHTFFDGFHHCEAITNTIFVLMTSSLISVYVLLWLRQRSFYLHPCTRHLETTAVRWLSPLTLGCIVVTGLLVPALFGLARHYEVSRNGCHLLDGSLSFHFVYLVVTAALSIVFHLCLLYLFVRPILTHRNNVQGGMNNIKSRGTERLIAVVKRAVGVTIVCVILDATIASITFLSANEPVHTIVEDIIVLANIIGMPLTFVDWRRRLNIPRMKFSLRKSFRRSTKSNASGLALATIDPEVY
nr:uncharacterized protein LOC113474011 [Ciona intestinalis]|eukprot:XP_018669058.1 uncharacterized protein LOC113474011 [Ciona intestinalis]